jgi:cation:H+ antiporter
VGTNLVNILLILGLSALIAPLTLDTRTVRFDLPCMTAASLVLLLVALDGTLGTLDGVLLVLLGIGYTLAVLRTSRQETPAVQAEYQASDDVTRARPWLHVVSLLVGIAVIVIGATLLVDGAVDAARAFGVSDVIIGLTIIAIGTSAPELVTTIVSTLRGNRDIALGNLLGSSVYNIAIILGVTILVAPGAVEVPDEILGGDLLLMVGAAVACIPVFMSGRRITRIEGGVFVAAYVAYLAWLLISRA